MNQFASLLIYYTGFLIPVLISLISIWRWFAVPADRKRTERLLAVALLVDPAVVISKATADALSSLRPLKYDLYIFRIDALFGEPSFRIGQIILPHPGLNVLMQLTYSALPIAMLGTFAVYLWLRPAAETLKVARTFALNLFVAVGFYLLFPVCGPAFAFPQFPLLPPAHLTPHALAIAAAPNGIPSVHTSTALLVLWFLRPWRWGRFAGIVFLALTVLSTLSGGQHYFFDLLCAVPYAVGIVWLDHRIEARPTAQPIRAHLASAGR
jgi:hypothetical protein